VFTCMSLEVFKIVHDFYHLVEADTINTFKNRLDKYWSNQDVLFNFNADLIGTGSLPICM